MCALYSALLCMELSTSILVTFYLWTFLTLSLLGYLQPGYAGGGQFDPPPLNPMLHVQIWQMTNLQFFFAKLVQSVSIYHRLSKKLNFIKIWQVEVGQNKDLVCYRKKQSFRQCAWELRQLVLKPGFRPKGRALGM